MKITLCHKVVFRIMSYIIGKEGFFKFDLVDQKKVKSWARSKSSLFKYINVFAYNYFNVFQNKKIMKI